MSEWPARCARVVFVAPRLPELSGGATYVENMSLALSEIGIEVVHVSLRPGTGTSSGFPTFVVDPQDLRRAGAAFRVQGGQSGLLTRLASISVVLRRRRYRRRQRRLLLNLLRTWGEETLMVFTHVVTKQALDDAGWRPPVADRPILVGQHHSQFEAIDIESWLRPAMLQHYQDLDAMTALTVADSQKFAGLLPVPCVGIGNPVAPPTALRAARLPREPLAVALARLSGEKQLDVMIRCFVAAQSTQGLAHWRLEIYGEGDRQEDLERLVAQLGADQSIRFMGRTDDVPAVLARASVNLLTSSYEGFPMSILEAAVAGVPTIAFDVSPGVRELVGEREGHLVPAGDEEAYAATLRQALQSPLDLAERGESARRCSQRYSSENILGQWADLVADCYRRRAR